MAASQPTNSHKPSAIGNNNKQEILAKLFTEHYNEWVQLAYKFLNNYHDAEELVGDVSVELCKNSEKIRNPCRSLVWKNIVYRCLDIIRRKKGFNPPKEQPLITQDEETEDKSIDDEDKGIVVIEEVSKIRKICRQVIKAAGFLQPSSIKPLFRQAMRSHSSEIAFDKIHQYDDRVNLDIEECIEFLRLDALHSLTENTIPHMLLYRKEVEKVIKSIGAYINTSAIPLLIDTHMVSMAWPGWPSTPLYCIVDRRCTPPRLLELCEKLDKHVIREKPEEFQVFLERIREPLLDFRHKIGWPFSETCQSRYSH